MKKILIGLIFLTSFSCAHRGLDLDDQIPERFLESARANTPSGYSLLGVMEERATMKAENILFSSESARQIFVEMNDDDFYHQVSDSSGKLTPMNLSLKQDLESFVVHNNEDSNIYSGYSLVDSSYSDSKAVLIRSFSNQQFSLPAEEGVWAH